MNTYTLTQIGSGAVPVIVFDAVPAPTQLAYTERHTAHTTVSGSEVIFLGKIGGTVTLRNSYMVATKKAEFDALRVQQRDNGNRSQFYDGVDTVEVIVSSFKATPIIGAPENAYDVSFRLRILGVV